MVTSVALILGAAQAALAQPAANDQCAGAIVIAPPLPALSSAVDITDATTVGDPSPLPGMPCTASTTLSRSVWFTFTPSVTERYEISTCADAPCASTVNDTVMAIYTSAGGCGGPFTQIACDDDSCKAEDFQSRVVASLTAGTPYYIVVWNRSNTAPTVGNATVQLRVSVYNDTCASAVALPVNRSTLGSAIGAQNDYQLAAASACFPATVGQVATTAAGGDAVYSFSAPATGSYSFKSWLVSGPGSPNPVLYTANACPAATPGTPVTVACTAASNRAVTSEEIRCVPLTTGQQVFLFVDQTAVTAGGPFFVQVETCTVQESEPNDTPATADPAVCTTESSIVPGGDVDFFGLGTVPVGSRIFAMLDGSASTSGDTQMRVTTTVDTLEFDDDDNFAGWSTLSPNIAGCPATGAPTFLRVNHFSVTEQTDPYRLYTALQPALATATAETEPNNTTATANAAANNYFFGELPGPPPSVDFDLYSFTANAGDLIYVGLDGDPLRNNTPIDPLLALLDAAGNVLALANDGSFTSDTTSTVGTLTATTPHSPGEGLIFRAPTTGTYFVDVEIGFDTNTPDGAGDYLLSISKNCSQEGRFWTLTPCRAVDTRNPDGPYGGPAFHDDGERTYNLVGVCGIPATAKAVAINVTAVTATGGGQFTLFPDVLTPTNTIAVAFNPGNTRAAQVVVGLDANGSLTAFAAVGSDGQVHLLIDVTGYFE